MLLILDVKTLVVSTLVTPLMVGTFTKLPNVRFEKVTLLPANSVMLVLINVAFLEVRLLVLATPIWAFVVRIFDAEIDVMLAKDPADLLERVSNTKLEMDALLALIVKMSAVFDTCKLFVLVESCVARIVTAFEV